MARANGVPEWRLQCDINFESVVKADFLSWQKPLANQLRVLADNFSLLPAPQRVLAAWFKIFN